MRNVLFEKRRAMAANASTPPQTQTETPPIENAEDVGNEAAGASSPDYPEIAMIAAASAASAGASRGASTAAWRLRLLTSGGLLTSAAGKSLGGAAQGHFETIPVSPQFEETPEEFFHLYAGLERSANGRRAIGVTSAVPGEGKTTVALHLALSAARTTHLRICLLDLNLGDDDLCQRIGVAPAPGGVIPELEADGPLALLECGGDVERLTIVPAAGKAKVPAQAARSPRAATLIEALREEYDLVVVDMPAVSTDNALPLAALMDGVLLVTRAGATSRAVVRTAIDILGRERVVGMVLNRVTSGIPKKKDRKS